MTPAEHRGPLPTAEVIDAVARETISRLPSPFRESLGDIVITVAELADNDTVQRLRLDEPMRLSGLYEGVPLNRQSVSQSGTLPERITLFRLPIIAEWRSSDVSLEQIVAHIVIHEIGHHFGFSDADMHALERDSE